MCMRVCWRGVRAHLPHGGVGPDAHSLDGAVVVRGTAQHDGVHRVRDPDKAKRVPPSDRNK